MRNETGQTKRHDLELRRVCEPCVWMLAGVVDYKLCDRYYDCERCPFDQVINDRSQSRQPGTDSDLAPRALKDWMVPPPDGSFTTKIKAKGYEQEETLFYHPAHVWARIEGGGMVRAGVDDLGQQALGRVFFVELPEEGREVRQGETCWRVMHQAGEAELVAPVSGVVQKVNTKLTQSPSLLNRDPYGEGWALLIEPTRLEACLKRIYFGQKAHSWREAEIEKLYQKVNGFLGGTIAGVGVTMPDGGARLKDCMSELAADEMRQLVDSLFSAPLSEAREVEDGPQASDILRR